MAATNIDEVIIQLTSLIKDSIEHNDRIGYFSALYFKVASRIKEGILNHEFEDGPRMEKLDVTFANRFLDAVENWKNDKPVSGSWKVALDATEKSSLLVLQHLLLGMNAHINFDLGIAAVETAAGSDLQSIQNDFNSINTILAALTYQVINEIDRVSPLLSLLGFHATNYQSILIQFTISSARDGAWAFAETLCNQKGSAYESSIADRDKNIRKLGMAMIHPALAIRFTIWVIHLFEWKKPSAIIKSLDQYKKKYLKASELGS